MNKIDFRVHAHFAGHDVILAPSNQKNREALQKAYQELSDFQEAKQWYDEQVEKVRGDDRLKDSTRQKKLDDLDKQYVEKVEKYTGKLPEHRKRVCNIMIAEWDSEPKEDFWSNELFDDYALSRLLTFFLNPKGLTPSEPQSNGSLI